MPGNIDSAMALAERASFGSIVDPYKLRCDVCHGFLPLLGGWWYRDKQFCSQACAEAYQYPAPSAEGLAQLMRVKRRVRRRKFIFWILFAQWGAAQEKRSS